MTDIALLLYTPLLV